MGLDDDQSLLVFEWQEPFWKPWEKLFATTQIDSKNPKRRYGVLYRHCISAKIKTYLWTEVRYFSCDTDTQSRSQFFPPNLAQSPDGARLPYKKAKWRINMEIQPQAALEPLPALKAKAFLHRRAWILLVQLLRYRHRILWMECQTKKRWNPRVGEGSFPWVSASKKSVSFAGGKKRFAFSLLKYFKVHLTWFSRLNRWFARS